jgi:hypothetical protein
MTTLKQRRIAPIIKKRSTRMNEKNTDDMFRLLFNAAYLAALPDTENMNFGELKAIYHSFPI